MQKCIAKFKRIIQSHTIIFFILCIKDLFVYYNFDGNPILFLPNLVYFLGNKNLFLYHNFYFINLNINFSEDELFYFAQ